MEIFNIKIFEDEKGTRFIYCDGAIAAISGPSPDDKIIAEFSHEHEEQSDLQSRLLRDRGWYQRGNGTWSHAKDGHIHRSKQDALNLTTMTVGFLPI